MRVNRSTGALIGLLVLLAGVRSASAQASAAAGASRVDLNRLRQADALIDRAIAAGKCPGAVLLVGRGDEIIYRKAYGNRSLEPARRPETTDAVFDLASLTKSVATAPSILILADRGKLSVKDKVAKYLPAFARAGKQDVTIEQLLLHRGGLVPDDDLADYAQGPAQAWERICALQPRWTPGTHFAYSDVGYIVLGKLVEAVSGKPLDQFAREEIFEPLGMDRTRFKPPADWQSLCAPTERRDGHWMVGEVHDPRAYALGRVAGHAGLFGTADDLSRFCRMLLHEGELDGRRVLQSATVREMIRPRPLPDGTGARGYGFDVDTPYSTCRGDRFARGVTFGHTGFTGVMFWVDPVNRCYFVLLTNSVHPNGHGRVIELRHDVATVVAEALLGDRRADGSESPAGPVLCGIDVLERQDFAPLAGKRVALVTNQTGLDAAGNRTADVLHAAKNVRLVKLFSPEHGLLGRLDQPIDDSVDPQTGLKVYSLFGRTRQPSAQMLDGVDALVYDIQDVGARFYTYTSTLGLCMEAGAKFKIPVFVLDRPNPITGTICDGPVADETRLGFTAYAPIPVVHGMTEGELAGMFNVERNIHCDLTVVPMRGWKRSMWWDQTGRMWVNPSPNLRNATQALLYPGVALLEGENVSVGRGTDQPFETFGAPWVDGRKLAAALNADDCPGLRFVPITFTPASSRYSGKECQGCYVEVIDRGSVEPVRAGLTIAWELERLFGKSFEAGSVNALLCSRRTADALVTTDDPRSLPATWREPLEAFERVREKYLIYP